MIARDNRYIWSRGHREAVQDPARVLAECEAKRLIIAMHERVECST
jgi:HEPN domain-containing protein